MPSFGLFNLNSPKLMEKVKSIGGEEVLKLLRVRPIPNTVEEVKKRIEEAFGSKSDANENHGWSISKKAFANGTHLDPYDVLHGDLCPQLLDFAVQWGHKNSDWYAPYTTMVSPSMAGETFLLKALANHYDSFLAYVCLRPSEAYGIPKETMHIAPHLKTTRYPVVSFVTFFVAALECILKMADLDEHKGKSDSELIKVFNDLWWNDEESDDQLILKQMSEGILELDHKFGPQTEDSKKKDGKSQENPHKKNKVHEKIEELDDLLRSNFNKVCARFSKGLTRKRPSIIFAFDEALMGKKARSRFIDFRYALTYLPKVCCKKEDDNIKSPFVIVIDTTAKVSDYEPPQAPDPSTPRRGCQTALRGFSPLFIVFLLSTFTWIESNTPL